MIEELTEERLNEAKSKNEDNQMTKWTAKGTFVYDPFGNVVCECYDLGCWDQKEGRAWAKHNARTIAFLHNVRLAKDKIISQANPISKED